MDKQRFSYEEENIRKIEFQEKFDSLCSTNATITELCHHELVSNANPSNGVSAREKLYQKGLTDVTIRLFKLGYTPPCMDNLSEFLKVMNESGVVGGVKSQDVENTRLFRTEPDKDGKRSCILQNRIIVPIADSSGNIVAFSGYDAFRHECPGPIFLNMADSDLYQKKQIIFGLNLAKWSKQDFFILCEGYFDVMHLHQNGFDSAVASIGVRLARQQARLLKVYKEKVIIYFDTDECGKKEALQAAELLREEGLQVGIVDSSIGRDLADMMRNSDGKGVFEKALATAKEIAGFDE